MARWLVAILGLALGASVPTVARAQDPPGIEVLIPRRTLTEQLVPVLLHGWAADGRVELAERLEGLNEPVIKRQSVRMGFPDAWMGPLQNLGADGENAAGWTAWQESLRGYEIALDVEYELSRGVQGATVDFPRGTRPDVLTAARAKFTGKPRLKIRRLGAVIVNDATGEHIPIGLDLGVLGERTLSMPHVEVELDFEVVDNLAGNGAPVRVRRTGLRSNLPEARLDARTTARVNDALWSCENLNAVAAAATQTQAWREAVDLLERDLKNRLAAQTLPARVWVEIDDAGELHPRIQFERPLLEGRLEELAKDNRLLLKGRAHIPLGIDDVAATLDMASRRLNVGVTSPRATEVHVDIDALYLPPTWAQGTGSEPLRKLLRELEEQNLAANGMSAAIPVTFPVRDGTLSVGVRCDDGALQLDPGQMTLDLAPLGGAIVGGLSLQGEADGPSVFLDPRAGDLGAQLFEQLPDLIALGQHAAGADTYDRLSHAIGQEIELQIQAIGADMPEVVADGTTRVGFRVAKFDAAPDALHIDWTLTEDRAPAPGMVASGGRLPGAYREYLNTPPLHRVRATMKFPQEIVIDLTDARSDAGEINGRTRVRLESSLTAPTLDLELKVVEGPDGRLLLVPERDNVEALITSYSVPEAYDAVEFGGEISGSGVRGWFGNRIQDLGDWITPDEINRDNFGYAVIGWVVKGSVTATEEDEAEAAIRDALSAAQGDLARVLWGKALNIVNGPLEPRRPAPGVSPARPATGPLRYRGTHSTVSCHAPQRRPMPTLERCVTGGAAWLGLETVGAQEPKGILTNLHHDLLGQLVRIQEVLPRDGRVAGLTLGNESLVDAAERGLDEVLVRSVSGGDGGAPIWPARWTNAGLAQTFAGAREQTGNQITGLPGVIAGDVEGALGPQLDEDLGRLQADIVQRVESFLRVDTEAGHAGSGFRAPHITSAHVVAHGASVPYYDVLLYTDAPRRTGTRQAPPGTLFVPGRPLGAIPQRVLEAHRFENPTVVLSTNELNAVVADNLEFLRQTFEDLIRYETDAQGRFRRDGRGDRIERFGINDTLEVRLERPRFSVSGDHLVVDAQFEVEQSAVLTQRIVPLAGHLLDGILSPLLAIDTGTVEARLVLGLSDPTNVFEDGQHKGYAIQITNHDLRLESSGLKPLTTLFFEGEAEDQLRRFETTLGIGQVLEMPGTAGQVSLGLGDLKMIPGGARNQAVAIELQPIVDWQISEPPIIRVDLTK